MSYVPPEPEIEQEGQERQEDIRHDAAQRELVDEARRDSGSKPQSILARFLAPFRKRGR